MAPLDPLITTTPELWRRQEDADLIGYVSVSNGLHTPQWCPDGQIDCQGPTYADCCEATATACYPPVACVGGSMFHVISPSGSQARPRSSQIECTLLHGDGNSQCQTLTSALPWTVHRELSQLDVQATSTFASSYTKAASSAQTSSPTQDDVDNFTLYDVSIPPKRIWIGWAVIGPLIGFLVIGLITSCLYHRRKRTQSQASNEHVTDTTENQSLDHRSGSLSSFFANGEICATHDDCAEMPTSYNVVYSPPQPQNYRYQLGQSPEGIYASSSELMGDTWWPGHQPTEMRVDRSPRMTRAN